MAEKCTVKKNNNLFYTMVEKEKRIVVDDFCSTWKFHSIYLYFLVVEKNVIILKVAICMEFNHTFEVLTCFLKNTHSKKLRLPNNIPPKYTRKIRNS